MASTSYPVGILAYGSLIDDPGAELGPRIVTIIRGVETPFKVEFARKSRTRGDAPTLIPVSEGGAHVQAAMLVVDVSPELAQDMIWRRETRCSDPSRRYARPAEHLQNAVRVEQIEDFAGVGLALFTSIGANIQPLTAGHLAELAIASVAGAAPDMDGISYLMAAKGNGIATGMSAAYEAEILKQTGTANLADALTATRRSR